MDAIDIILRIIGAFYAFAGYVATRAGLTSHFVDRAIAAISMKKPPRAETAQTFWLLGASTLVLTGGVALALLLEVATWLFIASALGQAFYIYFLAPRYFDAANPPEGDGRKSTSNAFVLYLAATAFVAWAFYTGRLLTWDMVPPLLLAIAAAGLIVHVGYLIFMLARAPGKKARFGSMLGGGDDDNGGDMEDRRAHSKRIKVMADYDAYPVWALDEDIYGDFPPERLGLSPELTSDLNTWADAYQSSLNREDPLQSLWSDQQHKEHAMWGRPLAVRLKRERPDLMVFFFEDGVGVVEVHAQEAGDGGRPAGGAA